MPPFFVLFEAHQPNINNINIASFFEHEKQIARVYDLLAESVNRRRYSLYMGYQ